ncbi:HNH endonuclease [Pseudoclavibacter alba]|uniref:HNH endonuclease n=1 Tax=Pseudoclavibacter albus TaxID=272241 RepID=UPI0019D09BD1|nr:HNH endonuclease [Pseudoclavibacter alba]
MPGWRHDNRQPLPKGWRATRQRILSRDNYQCTWIERGQRCTAKATDVDHIVNRRDGGTHDDTNLRSLCRTHHARKSSAEGGRAERRRSRYRLARPEEKHPGIR